MGWLPAGILQDNPIRIFGRRDGDARPGYCGELSAAHRIKKPRIGPQIYALFNPCLHQALALMDVFPTRVGMNRMPLQTMTSLWRYSPHAWG